MQVLRLRLAQELRQTPLRMTSSGNSAQDDRFLLMDDGSKKG
jgi:hypothetical protein